MTVLVGHLALPDPWGVLTWVLMICTSGLPGCCVRARGFADATSMQRGLSAGLLGQMPLAALRAVVVAHRGKLATIPRLLDRTIRESRAPVLTLAGRAVVTPRNRRTNSKRLAILGVIWSSTKYLLSRFRPLTLPKVPSQRCQLVRGCSWPRAIARLSSNQRPARGLALPVVASNGARVTGHRHVTRPAARLAGPAQYRLLTHLSSPWSLEHGPDDLQCHRKSIEAMASPCLVPSVTPNMSGASRYK